MLSGVLLAFSCVIIGTMGDSADFVVPEGAVSMHYDPQMVQTALGMHMPGMHEPSGKLGRQECRLRSVDRVLRQHPKDYQGVRDAFAAFQSRFKASKKKPVQVYFSCVVGMGMMLADCNCMPEGQMMTDAIQKSADQAIVSFLKTDGAKLTHVFEEIQKADGFAHHMAGVEGVVCDKPVYEDVSKVDRGATTEDHKHEDEHAAAAAQMGSMDMKTMDMKDDSSTAENTADDAADTADHTADATADDSAADPAAAPADNTADKTCFSADGTHVVPCGDQVVPEEPEASVEPIMDNKY